MESLSLVQQFSVWLLPVLFAITLHEVAHGFVADLFGDDTARSLGRLTLNPIKHIDPIGTILVPAVLFWLGGFIFGWAKPVPVNVARLHHLRRDMALVALAGPAANFLMALFWWLLLSLGMVIEQRWLIYSGYAGILINLIIAILNLLPILPLDGGRILTSLLPNRLAYYYARLEPVGLIVLLALLAFGFLGDILSPIITFLLNFMLP